MSLKNLDILFNPRRIAVVGANEDEASIGFHLFRNLIGKGFKGIVHPVNPDMGGVQGVEAYPSVLDIPHPVDLALVATEPRSLPAVLEDCARKGIKGMVILAHDHESRIGRSPPISDRIRKLSALYGCRVLGPGSLGFLRPAINLNASLYPKLPLQGNIAFISESGIFSTEFLEHAISKKVGFSYFVSLGAKQDINIADTIDFLGGDGGTRAIFLLLRTINNGRRFMAAVRNFARTKPIVVVKPGKGGGYSLFAEPHLPAREDLIYEAVFKRAGCLRVDDILDLLSMVETIAKQNRPKGKRLMIVSNSIVPAEMAIDALQAMGGLLATPGQETLTGIGAALPAPGKPFGRPAPLYLPPGASAEDYRSAIESCLQAPEIDGLMVICTPFPGIAARKIAEVIVAAAAKRPAIPLFSTWFGEETIQDDIDFLHNYGIPTYYTPEQAVKSFMYMYRYDYNLKLLQETPDVIIRDFAPKLAVAKHIISGCLDRKRYTLHADEAGEILRSYSIPVIDSIRVDDADEAVQAALRLGHPVAMKIDGEQERRPEDIVLHLENAPAVRQAYAALRERLAPQAGKAAIIVQPMVEKRGYQLLIGAQKSRNFGTVIFFGLGGKYYEAERDHAYGLPPLNQTLARRMMEETRIYPYLQQLGALQVGLRALEEMLVRFSQLVIDLPQIGSIAINPLILTADACLVRDVSMRIDESLPKGYKWAQGDFCPLHLSIPPYPFKYEKDFTLIDGTVVHIRPIRGEDEPALSRFFEALSEESVFFRFGQRRINMPHDHLARFCQVDYDRDLAFLAVVGGEEEIIGDVRLNRFPDLESAELSFTVADKWQGRRVGSLLMNFCIRVAKEIGLKTLLMEIMKGNTPMIRLGCRYGFERILNNRDDDMEEMYLELS